MEKARRKGWRIALAVLAVFLIVTLAGALYLFFVPVDLTRHHSRIESLIEAKTGHRITMERVVLKALPAPDLSIKGIRVFQGSEELLGVRSLRLRLQILPMLFNDFIIEALDLSGVELALKRDEAGRWNIEEFFRPAEGGAKVSLKSLNLTGGRIRVTDRSVPGGASYDFRGINAYLHGSPDGFTYKAEARLMPDTRLTVSGSGDPKKPEFKGTGAIKAIELSDLGPYIKKGTPEASLKGRADLEFSYSYAETGSLKGVLRYKGLEADYPPALGKPVASASGDARVSLLWKGKDIDLTVRDVRLTLEDFRLSGSFRLSGQPLKRTFTLNISTTPVPLKSFRDLIPLKAMPPTPADKINAISPLGGELAVETLSAHGTVDDLKSGALFKKPDAFTISVVLDGLEFRYRGFNEKFSGFKGRINLKDKALSFIDITGRYNKEIIEGLKGRIAESTGRLRYDFSLTGSFDIAESLGLARSLSNGKDPALAGTLRKADASGDVGLKLNVSGEIAGTEPPRYSGTSSVKNMRFSYSGLPASLESLNGEIAFDNRTITLNSLRGGDGHSDFRLKGRIDDYTKETPSFNIEAEGSAAGQTISPFIKQRRIEGLAFSGSIPFRAKIAGSKDSFEANAALDATGADVAFRKMIKKEAGYPLSLEASVKVSGKDVEIKSSELKFSDSGISLSGSVSLDGPVYRLSARSNQLRLADLDNISPFLVKDYESDGLVSFNLRGARGPDDPAPRYEGDIKVKDARFKSPYIGMPVERINAEANLRGNRGSLTVEGLSAGGTEIRGRLEMPDVYGKVIRFEITSPRLNTDDLIPRRERKEGEAGKKKAPPELHWAGSGSIKIAKGSLFGHPFSDFQTEVTIERDAVYMRPFRLNIDRGLVYGNAVFYTDPREPLLFETGLVASNIHLDTMLGAFGARGGALTGDLQGRLTISGKRGASPFTSGLNGEASLRSDRGKLWKFSYLTKIFSFINIISIDELFKEGMPYKHIKGNFSMKNGIISTNDLLFDGDSMRMSATGKIDIPELYIDSILAMRPFVTLDKIISSIPLAGWVVTGKEKSALSMYFDINGPLNDPDIDPLPIISLEKGILGLFQRLLEAPAEALTPESR